MVSRAEHRERMLRALSDAATAEIEAHGPDVTIAQIAERAGVARRTVYRWVDTRDDLVFIHPRLWLEHFDDVVSPLHDRPLRDRIVAGVRAICQKIDDDPEPVRRALRVALAHPELMRGYGAMSQSWIDRIAREVQVGQSDSRESRFRARVVGSAIMGMIDAALAEWMHDEPTGALLELVEFGFDHVLPIID